MELRKALSDYTERQFEQFVQEMIDDVGTENYQDELMYHFDLLVGELGNLRTSLQLCENPRNT